MEYFGYFILGLGLNLTPCVYPMLTITLSLFRGSETHTSWRAFGHALLYVLGIAVMFTSVGVFAALTGEFFGGLLQNFWVLLAIGLFIITLSLSMFGLYVFRFPSWLVPQHQVRHVHLFSYLISGLLVGIVAAPCMGPVVLALLTHVSREKDIAFGAASFFMMALGLGFPYLLLGTFTGFLKKLPKAGAWLIWFERLLAVVLLTFGCFYIIVAFQWPFLAWLIPFALFGGGIYLGWFERSAHESKKFVFFKRIAGTLATALGLMLIAGMVSFTMEGTGPESEWASESAGTMVAEISEESKAWEKYRPEILAEARLAGQPVILDFYADWCIPCHELSKYTFSNSLVIQALRNFKRVKVDTTFLYDDATKEIVKRFGVYGVPTVLFLDENGKEIKKMRINGFISPGEFLDLIRSGPLGPYAAEGESS